MVEPVETAAAAKRQPEKTKTWRFFAAIVVPLVLLLAKFTFHNPEKIPKTGAFIMTANHISDFDPLVTAYTLWHHGRPPHYLAKASLFRVPIVGRAFTATDQVPVERAKGGSEPLAAAEKLIEKQLAVVIYPEGTLTREPNLWPMRGKYGAMRLALQHDLPVIPCAQWGAQRVLPRWSRRLSLFPRKQVDVLIGDPVDLSEWRGKQKDIASLQAATEKVMHEITRLLAELRPGETPPTSLWDPAEHGQSEYGRIEEPPKA